MYIFSFLFMKLAHGPHWEVWWDTYSPQVGHD